MYFECLYGSDKNKLNNIHIFSFLVTRQENSESD